MLPTLFATVAAVSFRLASAQGHNLGEFDLNQSPNEQGYCGLIVNDNINSGSSWFYASDVIECLTSVPFNPAVAVRFLDYYNQTLQFQSNTAYIKNPPPGYQHQPYDVFGELQRIRDDVKHGYYHNQYAFEADLQQVSLHMHDSHVTVYAGVLNQFTFASPFQLVSLSSDGKATPIVYMLGDNGAPVLRAISKIDNLPVHVFLQDFAANQSFGMVDADADWNQLMVSPAQTILGTANPFSGGATFYPGEYMTIEYEDNSEPEYWYWLALYNSPGFTGPLETGGDFYNYFVLNNPPANFDETYNAYIKQQNLSESAVYGFDSCNHTSTSWNEFSADEPLASAYPPDTLSHQDCLGFASSGFITSYFYDDIKTAIVSIPSFDEYGDGIGTFSQAVSDFIQKATDKKAEHIIIDLQQNTGGQESLAFDVFRLFFPSVQPFAGSRMRSHSLANDIGAALTEQFQSTRPSDADYDLLVYSEWVVTDRENVQTGQNFSSWQEYYGPLRENGDEFSLTQRYNLKSEVFDGDALGIEFPTCFYEDNCQKPPWSGDQIVLLTDAVCASSCSLFVEMMTQDVQGVRSVVVGGRPQSGPMQTASGSRGARAYSSTNLDGDVYDSQIQNPVAAALYTKETGMSIAYLGLNLRDQIRKNSSLPTQFLYAPADCRIYWTLDNWNNYTQLWHDVYQAIQDTTLCVPGSVNATAPSLGNRARFGKRWTGEESSSLSSYIKQGLTGDTSPGHDLWHPSGYLDGNPAPKHWNICNKKDPTTCKGGSCVTLSVSCTQDSCKGRQCSSNATADICMNTCRLSSSTDAQGANCDSLSSCRQTSFSNSKILSSANVANVHGGQSAKNYKGNKAGYKVGAGLCTPNVPDSTGITCSQIQTDDAVLKYINNGFL